ncbi:MAG: hypothetical protein JNM53_11110 [Gemmatimonadetes bacterium]|nr:hypothetical protein [Gemmatimonadota bacterium]
MAPRWLRAAAMAAALTAAPLAAQERPTPLAVGAMAPDFVRTGATRAGVLERPVRLSDFRDQTLVIAFFYRARTKG